MPTGAVEKSLPARELMQAMVNEISWESAFGYPARISQFDRVQASIGWHDAAVRIKGELDRMGYKDAMIEGGPRAAHGSVARNLEVVASATLSWSAYAGRG